MGREEGVEREDAEVGEGVRVGGEEGLKRDKGGGRGRGKDEGGGGRKT